MVQLDRKVPSKVGILKMLDFPIIIGETSLPPDVAPICVTVLLSIFWSYSFIISYYYCRGQICCSCSFPNCCWTCCYNYFLWNLLLKFDNMLLCLDSQCSDVCWLLVIMTINAARCRSVLACCWCTLALMVTKCSSYWSALAIKLAK